MREAILLASLLGVSVVSVGIPSAGGLGLVEDESSETHRRVRVALDEGALEARALAGGPWIDGARLRDRWQPVGHEPQPWQGFDRTVVLELQGDGRVMLADEASGIVLEVHTRAPEDPGTQGGPAGGPAPEGGADRPANRPWTNASHPPDPPTEETPDRSTLDEGAWVRPSPANASGGSSGEKGAGATDWLLVGLVVALGLVAVAPAMAGPVKRRLWQARSVLWRIWHRHRTRGSRKP